MDIEEATKDSDGEEEDQTKGKCGSMQMAKW